MTNQPAIKTKVRPASKPLTGPKYRTMFVRNVEPPIGLPKKLEEDPAYLVYVRKCAALCVAASKKVAIAQLNGRTIDVDEQVEKIMLMVWNNGFNSGLSKMDKMHYKVNTQKNK